MILAIIQARMLSTRLPGKVLKPLLGEPMLLRQIERIRRSREIQQILVATTVDSSDDPVVQLCKEQGIACFRGHATDCLNRFFEAAKKWNPRDIVRLTGDCPLTCPDVIDEVIRFYREETYDYASNAIECTFPDGLDVEVFSWDAFQTVHEKARLPSEREHVTSYFYKNPDIFKLGSFRGAQDLSKLRLTVDTLEDFVLVEKIFNALYPQDSAFELKEILAFLNQNQALGEINRQYARNEGYQKSVSEDPREDSNHG